MGQAGSSSAADEEPPAWAEPRTRSPLRWLRVSRASRSSLAAEWHWRAGQDGAASCHLLFLPSLPAADGGAGLMQRVRVDPSLGSFTKAGLAEDTAYRVCLQCAESGPGAAGSNATRAGDAARPSAELMRCVNVSTKQAHLPAIVGSCLGAVCAMVLVLALVLLSRRTKKYRKVTERQEAPPAKKVVVHEIAFHTENLAPAKMDLDSNSDAGYVYDGSEEQQGSTVSDDALTPPPHPPPPPPTATAASAASAASTGASSPAAAEETKTTTATSAPAERPELESLLPPEEPTAPAAATEGRQVIQVNETDEYAIDLRMCDSLSRQQSLKAAASAASASGSSGVGSAASAAAATPAPAAGTEEPAIPSGGAQQGSESSSDSNQRRSSQEGAASSVPSLYTQLIETL